MFVVFAANQVSAENMEELDEDIAVTQSQVNFTCPLTQVDHSNLPTVPFNDFSHLNIISSHLYLVSGNNILVSVSTKHRKSA